MIVQYIINCIYTKMADMEQELEGLGDRMKAYEHDEKVPTYKPFIVRLDGKNFSKFTKGLKKPFDFNFTTAMINTLNDLVLFSHAVTGFCCSDEISLVFPTVSTKEEYDAEMNKSVHFYNGRKTKTCTVLASKCSVLFNGHMKDAISKHESDYTEQFKEKVNKMQAIFDARIIEFPEDKQQDIVNNLLWRSVYDCHRNCVSTYARHCLGQKKVMNKNCTQMIKMMKEEGVDWLKVPLHFKFGVYAKKELRDMEINIKGEVKKFQRGVIVNKCFKIKYSDEMLKLVLSKYWFDDASFEMKLFN
jgi:tRNA(His) guanylyltransferase